MTIANGIGHENFVSCSTGSNHRQAFPEEVCPEYHNNISIETDDQLEAACVALLGFQAGHQTQVPLGTAGIVVNYTTGGVHMMIFKMQSRHLHLSLYDLVVNQRHKPAIGI